MAPKTEEQKMIPIILWLAGVPLGLIILLWIIGVLR
jgi:hypothetical protein